MVAAANTGRTKSNSAGIGLGIGDELRNRLSRDCWIYRHDHWCADDARHRRNIADEIVAEFVVERRIDRVETTDQEKRVAVCGRCPHLYLLLPAPGRFSMMNGWPSRTKLAKATSMSWLLLAFWTMSFSPSASRHSISSSARPDSGSGTVMPS